MLKLCLLVLLAPLCHGVLKIPLVKVDKLPSGAEYKAMIEQRYGGVKASEAYVPLTTYQYKQYYGKISIGTPKPGKPNQYFNVAFDTAGGPIVGVASSKCPHKRGFEKKYKFCENHTLFDSSESTTYHVIDEKGKCEYRDMGEMDCIIGNDTVCAGGLCVKDQPFGAATTVPDAYLQYQFDGVIGMGFVADIKDNDGLPWFYNLIQNKSLNISRRPYFTFYLNGTGSKLILGGVDGSLISGTFLYARVNSGKQSYFWQFPVESLMATNGTTTIKSDVCGNGCNVTLDSGMPYIAGPSEEVQSLQDLIGAKKDNNDYTIDCDKRKSAPVVIMTVYGVNITLNGNDYIMEPEKDKCISAFVGIDAKQWILGDVFLAAYYTVFDAGENRRVAFARAVHV